MYRIDNPTAAEILPTPAQPGAPGYFTNGDPLTGEAATIVEADFMNSLQEEISHVVEAAGLTLSKSDRTQLYQAIGLLTRIRLTAPTTFFVSPTGNDNNNGLTTATAWASFAHAYNYIRDRIDLNGYQVVVQAAQGTYAGFNCAFPVVGPPPIFRGVTSDSTQVVISAPNGAAVSLQSGAQIVLDSVTVTAGGTTTDYAYVGNGIALDAGCGCTIRNLNFGNCSNAHMVAGSASFITAGQAGMQYRINGSAPAHIIAEGGLIAIADAIISIGGNPNWTNGFAVCTVGGQVQAWGCTFTGASTGVRYRVRYNGVIATNNAGANYFPGNAAGIADTGGQYY